MKVPRWLAIAVIAAIVFVAAFSIVKSQVTKVLSYEQVNEIAENVTVLIDGCASGEVGSGAIVRRDGNNYSVLTVQHAIDNPDECFVITPDKQRHKVASDSVSIPLPGIDLAVFSFTSDKKPPYRVAEFGNSEEVTIGKKVYVAGFPEPNKTVGRIFLLPQGNIIGRADGGRKGYSLVYDNTTRRGMSGGPVLDENGRLTGVHGRAALEEDVNTGEKYGIPIKTFLASPVGNKFVSQSPSSKPAPPSSSPWVSWLGGISGMIGLGLGIILLTILLFTPESSRFLLLVSYVYAINVVLFNNWILAFLGGLIIGIATEKCS